MTVTPPRVVLVDPEAAAAAVGRPRSTIDRWAHSGWLTKHGTRRARLYNLLQVYEVAARLDTPKPAKEGT